MKSFDCKQCKVSADRSIFLTGLFKKLGRSGKRRTAVATYLSHRLLTARFPTPGSTWDHWVTFSLADGAEIALVCPEDVFQSLTPGQSGILTWEGETFVAFERKEQP